MKIPVIEWTAEEYIKLFEEELNRQMEAYTEKIESLDDITEYLFEEDIQVEYNPMDFSWDDTLTDEICKSIIEERERKK